MPPKPLRVKVDEKLADGLFDVIKESPQVKKLGISDSELKKKVYSFLSDPKKAHYLDEFLRILLNPDTLKVINPPYNSRSSHPSRTFCRVEKERIGLSIPLPGSDPSKASGFIKGKIHSDEYSPLDYRNIKASQLEASPALAVSSLRLIVEPKVASSLSFILEFTFPKEIPTHQLTFKICDWDFNYLHSDPLVFKVDKRAIAEISTASEPKCRERSADYGTTGTYRFKSEKEIDDILLKYFL